MAGNGSVSNDSTAMTKAIEKYHCWRRTTSPAVSVGADSNIAPLTTKNDTTFITDTSGALLTTTESRIATIANDSSRTNGRLTWRTLWHKRKLAAMVISQNNRVE